MRRWLRGLERLMSRALLIGAGLDGIGFASSTLCAYGGLRGIG